MVLVGTLEDLSHEIIVRFVAAELAITVAIGLREGVFGHGRRIRGSAITGRLTGSDCGQNECSCCGIQEFCYLGGAGRMACIIFFTQRPKENRGNRPVPHRVHQIALRNEAREVLGNHR